MNRLDKEYLEKRRDVPFLTERPSTYLKRYYYGDPADRGARERWPRPGHAASCLFDGEDQTVFASDWPHHDFDHPMKVDQMPFSNEVRRTDLRRRTRSAASVSTRGAAGGEAGMSRPTSGGTGSVGGSRRRVPGGQPRVVRVGRRRSASSTSTGASTGSQTCVRTRRARCARRRASAGTARPSRAARPAGRPDGGCEGEVVACPWHGIEYHVPTGQCLAFPEIRLRTYAVTVRDGEVQVHLS